LLLWDARTGQRITGNDPFAGHTGKALTAAWSPDGRTIATGSADSTLRLWNQHGGTVATLSGHSKEVQQVAWLAADLLVSGDNDGLLRWWSAAGTPLGQGDSSGCGVVHLALSPVELAITVAQYCTAPEIWR
jgi:WD40 repeat protein